jgi:hypothetical protein
VQGSFSHECGFGGCTNGEAADRLTVDHVWCRWQGDDVTVHARVNNGMNARVALSIVPRYRIYKGGTHGQSFGSDIPMKLQPHQTKLFSTNAGNPKGVPTGTRISECIPKLQDIDLAE